MYDAPHQFEPLMPATIGPGLLAKAEAIVRLSNQLAGFAHPSVRITIRELVRAMNSYYSNRIEGQSTHPHNIERALKQDFSNRPDIAKLQRVALAHIEAERELEQIQQASPNPAALSSARLLTAHCALYTRLAENDRITEDGRLIQPGQLRTQDVQIGRHIPPIHVALPNFLTRMDQVYAHPTRPMSPAKFLIATACCHHRSAWVHPFLDGNGRAIRLQSH
jgi:Fic family protein